MYLMKIQINFLYVKKFRYVFNENTYKFLMQKIFHICILIKYRSALYPEKILVLYLVKIQI